MNDLDRMIREALEEEDAKVLDEVGGELSLLQKALDLFRSTSAWLITGVVAVQLAFIGLAVFAGIAFFRSSDTKDLILWGVVFAFANLGVSMLKLWSWMEMNRNSVTREIKRLELQVAYMSQRLKQATTAADE